MNENLTEGEARQPPKVATHSANPSVVSQAPMSPSLNLLSESAEKEFYQSWLEQFFDVIPNAYSLLLVVNQELKGLVPVAVCPEKADDIKGLTELVGEVVEEKAALVTSFDEGVGYGVAYPLFLHGELSAVLALAIKTSSESELKSAMRILQWGAAGIEAHVIRQHLNEHSKIQTQVSSSVDMLSKILSEKKFDEAAIRLVSELAVLYACDLVSLGVIEHGFVRVCHLSSSTQFGKQMNLIRQIEAAMNEAVDQKQTVICPLPSDTTELHQNRQQAVSLAHRTLMGNDKDESLLTLPLYYDNECFGAVTLQRDVAKPFTHEEADHCESMLALVAACLDDKRENSKPLIAKASDAIGNQLRKITSSGDAKFKLVFSALLLAVSFLVFAQGEYRLSVDAQLKSVLQRAIVAPFDGYINTSPIRAGDVVELGDMLLSLDDRDLQLEKLRWLSQSNKLQRQYQEASAEHDRAKVNIITAQIQQAEAQLKLVESRLDRSTQKAPFSGLIVSGDLSQRLGGSVSQGELLYEISPLDAYRIKLLVKESRILDIKLGQKGGLHLSALPDQTFDFEIDRITPSTESGDGATHFVVEAKLIDPLDILRPGMEGVGKIYVDQRNLFGIWTRELREWMQLKQWAWWS